MAKKSSSSQRTSSKKSSSGTGAKKKPARKPDKRTIAKKKKKLRGEITVIASCFLCMFFLLSNFGLFGWIGTELSRLQKGLFGTLAYILPVLLAAAIILYIRNQEHFLSRLKLCCSLLSIFLLDGLFELMFGEERGLVFFDRYEQAASGIAGGGAIGGAISDALTGLFGNIGAYLILILLFLISMVIITEKSLVGAAKVGAERTLNAARTGKERYEAHHEEQRIKRQARREEEELRRREMNFPDLSSYDTEAMADKASVYASYGKEIIESRDYDDDSVPFEESREERYVSYAHIADGQDMDLDAARSYGYAVATDEDIREPKEVFVPSSLEAFEPALEAVDAGYGRGAQPGFNIHDSETEAADASAAERETKAVNEPAYGAYEDAAAALGQDEEGTEDTAREPLPTSGPDLEIITSATGKELSPVSRYERDKILSEKAGASTQTASSGQTVASNQAAANSHAEASHKAGAPAPKPVKRKPYRFPPLSLLSQSEKHAASDRDELRKTALKLREMLKSFGVGVTITDVTRGPSVTRYELVPDTGVSVSKITSRADDLKLLLAAPSIRIEAPIPGKAAVGIEVPNKQNSTVYLREIIGSQEFRASKSRLSFAIGRDIQGRIMVGDIAKMPHLLIAGATGSGKSVGINSLIISLMYKSSPEEVRMIMIDPKVVELSPYNGIPHLMIPVVTESKKALSTLNWAVAEMNDRYKKFAETGSKNLQSYNEKISAMPDTEDRPQKLPQIVIIIDELAELMNATREINSKDVEAAIVSLAQLARAAGMHLVIATQRPSVDVITGLIKANITSRIAFRTASAIDSRTILDCAGAESLIGLGDMLFLPPGSNQLIRIQGAYVSESEIERIVDYVSKDRENGYEEAVENSIAEQQRLDFSGGDAAIVQGDDRDALFFDAGALIVDTGKASIGMLQRKFKIGFNRAARIMDQLCEAGVVGEEEGTKPRRVLMDKEGYAEFRENGGHKA